MSYKISNCIPQLPVLDLQQAKLFYINELGCKLLSEYEDLLILELENNEFHLWKCDDKSIPASSSMYIRVINIASLYEKYKDSEKIGFPLKKQPWGAMEFYLKDDSGNFLKFGETLHQPRY